jgi:methanogenic corrinoid protein MtbC1
MKQGSATPCASEETYVRYLEALVAGDRKRCREAFETWLAVDTELTTLYQELLQRSLYDVGRLWELGRVSVATEHLATAITESLLTLVYPRLFNHPRVGRTAVVSCVANEYHQIGGRMVADIFELHGWRGHYLGANTPLQSLLHLLKDKKPDVAALSVSGSFGFETLLNAVKEIRAQFPTLPILVGGQGFRWGGREVVEEIPGVHYLESLTALESWMKTFPSS